MKVLKKILKIFVSIILFPKHINAFLYSYTTKPRYKRYIKEKIKRFFLFINPLYVLTWLIEDSWGYFEIFYHLFTEKTYPRIKEYAKYLKSLYQMEDPVEFLEYLVRVAEISSYKFTGERKNAKFDYQVKSFFNFLPYLLTYRGFRFDDYNNEFVQTYLYKRNFPLFYFRYSRLMNFRIALSYFPKLTTAQVNQINYRATWISKIIPKYTTYKLISDFLKKGYNIFIVHYTALCDRYPFFFYYLEVSFSLLYQWYEGFVLIYESFVEAYLLYYKAFYMELNSYYWIGRRFLFKKLNILRNRRRLKIAFGRLLLYITKFFSKKFRPFMVLLHMDAVEGASTWLLFLLELFPEAFTFWTSIFYLIIKQKKDNFLLVLSSIRKHGFFKGLRAWWFYTFLKGFTMMDRVSVKAIISTRIKWKIARMKALDPNFRKERYLYRRFRMESKKKGFSKTYLDLVYETFNDSYYYLLSIITDEKELRAYYKRKNGLAKDQRKWFDLKSNLFQLRNRWRFLRSFRIIHEDQLSYNMDAGKGGAKDVRKKRQYVDTLFLLWKTFYFWAYTLYVHRTKLEFWLRPFFAGLSWIIYVAFCPFYYLYFFLRRFVLPVFFLLKELWFGLGLKITFPLYVFFRKKALDSLQKKKAIFSCKFWAYYAPDLLDCFRGIVKMIVMFFVTSFFLIFFYEDILFVLRNWTLWFDKWLYFISFFVLVVIVVFSFFCRDFREVFYEEIEDLCIWWFILIYMGLVLYFVYSPQDYPIWWKYWKTGGLKGTNGMMYHQIIQMYIPHYRRCYIPPFEPPIW